MYRHTSTIAVLALLLTAILGAPAWAQVATTPRPSPTYKACHICEEEAAAEGSPTSTTTPVAVCAPATPYADASPGVATPLVVTQTAAGAGGSATAGPTATSATIPPRPTGFTPALVIMAGIIAALACIGVVLVRRIRAGP